eukprot:15364382-Ditylum_brightwellii.AAC.1
MSQLLRDCWGPNVICTVQKQSILVVECTSKETVLCIGELMQDNSVKFHRLLYQKYINTVLNKVTEEKHKEDPEYFKQYGTIPKKSKYDIQLRWYQVKVELQNEKVETETLAIYALKSHTRMAHELMEMATLDTKAYPNVVNMKTSVLEVSVKTS